MTNCYLVYCPNDIKINEFKQYFISISSKIRFYSLGKKSFYFYYENELYYNLFTAYSLLCNDFNCSFLILRSHVYNETTLYCFNTLIFKKTSGIYRLYDIALSLLLKNDSKIKNLIKQEFQSLNKELINIASTYLEADSNIIKASEMLHIHRNTFYYQLEHFISITSLDIRLSMNSSYFSLFLSLD